MERGSENKVVLLRVSGVEVSVGECVFDGFELIDL